MGLDFKKYFKSFVIKKTIRLVPNCLFVCIVQINIFHHIYFSSRTQPYRRVTDRRTDIQTCVGASRRTL